MVRNYYAKVKCGVVEIPEAPEVRYERRSEGIEATELYGESLECSNSTMK